MQLHQSTDVKEQILAPPASTTSISRMADWYDILKYHSTGTGQGTIKKANKTNQKSVSNTTVPP